MTGMQGRRWESPVREGPPPRHFLAGWFLSLLLHGVVAATILLFYRFAVFHPAGGGGGSGGGRGVAFVDLSGWGHDGPVAVPGAQGPAADDTGAAQAPTAPSEPSPAQTPAATSPPSAAPEKTVPVLAPQSKPAPRTKPVRHQRWPHHHEDSPSQGKPPAPGPTSALQTAGTGKGGPSGGAPGPGNGSDGRAAGSGGGSGGGEGTGKGPSVGPGHGIGEAGMSLAAVDVKPRIATQVKPEYPEEARRQGLHGRVITRFLVTAEGGVSRLSIVSAQPPHVFDRAVLEAVEKWRFHPAKFQGRDVAAWVMLPIRFDLKQ